jgi:hypothetical protein
MKCRRFLYSRIWRLFSMIQIYWRFAGSYSLHLHRRKVFILLPWRNSRFLQNFDKDLPDYTGSYPRRQLLSFVWHRVRRSRNWDSIPIRGASFPTGFWGPRSFPHIGYQGLFPWDNVDHSHLCSAKQCVELYLRCLARSRGTEIRFRDHFVAHAHLGWETTFQSRLNVSFIPFAASAADCTPRWTPACCSHGNAKFDTMIVTLRRWYSSL